MGKGARLGLAGGLAATLGVIGAILCVPSISWSRPEPLRKIVAPKGWVLKQDSQNYFQGPYVAFAGDWSVTGGKVSLKRGVDYADHILINPQKFPTDTVMHWQWPQTRAKSGVYGYLHVAYGNYAGGVPPKLIASRPISKISELKTHFAVQIDGGQSDYNLLSETFLTATPGGSPNSIMEVGFLPHISIAGREYFMLGKQLGIWTDPAGRRWKVAMQGHYCMFVPDGPDMMEGVLDFGSAFVWLRSQGLLTGREWFSGVAIGIEPVLGSGSAQIKQWDVTLR